MSQLPLPSRSPTTAPPDEGTPPPRRVFIETFGCQMNILDSELVQGQLSREGYAFTADSDSADIVLYNTCSVRDLSEQKVQSRLGRLKKQAEAGREVTVGVLGCMAERAGKDLVSKFPNVDLMCGPSELDQIGSLLSKLDGGQKRGFALSGHNARRSAVQDLATERLEALDAMRSAEFDRVSRQQYVRITRGCNKFCSFCVVPFTRGAEVHRPADAIVDEVRALAQGGAAEVTLLGQTINHYDQDGTNFAQLLRRVHDEVPELPRLRFLTSYPRDFTDEALDAMGQSERICPFLHIPAQHGNNGVLKRMNRGYTRELYLGLIERARERIPNLSIVGDMIVGFPGETDDEFQDSMTLLEAVRFKSVFVFKYSPRPGTVSNKKGIDDVPVKVKKERNNAMLALQRSISLEHHAAMMGQTHDILVEGGAKNDPEADAHAGGSAGLVTLGRRKETHVRLSGRTTGDHIVAFDGPESLIGGIHPVTISEARELSLSGHLART